LNRTTWRARDLGDATLAFRLEAELVNWLQLAPAAARGRLEPYAEGLEPGAPAAATLNALRAWWHTMIGDADAAQTARLARAALAGIGPDRGEHLSLTEAQAILALVRADRWQDATEAIAPRIDDARRRGSALAFVGMRWLEAYLAFAQGRVSDAVADARESIESARAGGYLVAFPFYSALLIEALVEADDLDAAETELVQTGMTGEMPDLYWLGPLLFARGRLRLAQARTDEGLEDLLEMGRRFDRDGMQDLTGCPWAATAAPVLAGRGERDRARALTQEELSRARRWGAPSAVGRSLRALALVEGGNRGVELLREAEAALEGSGAELVRAYVLADLGAALRRRGNRAAARDPLRRALDIAHRAGATRLATRAREELAATGARPRKLVLRGVDSLTPSELRAARMAADGLSNREIAQALFVTINTVETHLRHAYQKLAINRREQLADALHAHPGDPQRG
jgi:DNA-binding CsgD family transcriptional regulator